MPIYLYQEILPDGSNGECFEMVQRMSDPPLDQHPTSGHRIKKIFVPPNLPSKYTEAANKAKLSHENVEKHGFTKYEKDKVTGLYHKTAGKDKRAPDIVDTPRLKEMQKKGLL